MPGLFEQFPHTNLHELNLDWLIDMINQFKEELEDSAVLSVNGETGHVTLYESENVILPPLPSGTDQWRLVRMMNGQYVGILFYNNHAYVQRGNETMRLLTLEDIPTSSGVVSWNGLTGLVNVTGQDIPVDDAADADSIEQAITNEHTERVNADNTLQNSITALGNSLTWTKILDSYAFSTTGNIEIPSIIGYRDILVIVDTRKASDNQPFGYSNSLQLPAFLYGQNVVTFALPLVVGNFVKFVFTGAGFYVTELGTLPATANAYLFTIYAR